jgi:DNA invertase Pin-like site-specific DNA recombinase
MSTDHQKYSTENQLDTIRRYAEQRGYTIARIFEDSGRSGLRMDGRDGLKSLMLEVQSGIADFKAILVYDVSRWGRFQDADEGAYHEHVCSRAGIDRKLIAKSCLSRKPRSLKAGHCNDGISRHLAAACAYSSRLQQLRPKITP